MRAREDRFVRFVELATCSEAVAATTKRSEKVAALAAVLAELEPAEVVPAVAFLTGESHLGRIGVGWRTLAAATSGPAEEPTLAIAEVADTLGALAALGGEGSHAERARLLRELTARCTEVEQRFLAAVLSGGLRQGALAGVVATAVARAAGVPVAEVQRAAMMAGSLPDAAAVALSGGADGLREITLTPLRPVQPMLAASAPGVAEALALTGDASVEWKLDGARVQAHRAGGRVRLFTRNLNDVTDRLGHVASVVRELPGGDVVLDGEVLGVDVDGRPRAFQDSMGDFGADLPGRGAELRPFFFDVLYADGRSIVDEPLHVRRDRLAEVVPESARLPSITTADAAVAAEFLAAAVAAGHEGVMVKDLASTYEAGRRGGAWRKVKPVHTFDLVVLAVEWGHGRRTGLLSNLHLGARSDDGDGLDGDGFVMVGKTFKGLTDELLRWQTERFRELAVDDDGHVVRVRPEQVVEVAVDGVQRSTRYPGGVALRFARVRRYRHDKLAADADPIAAVQALLPG